VRLSKAPVKAAALAMAEIWSSLVPSSAWVRRPDFQRKARELV